MDYQLDTLHKPIFLSQDPEAKYSSFGENAKLFTLLLWPVRVLMHSPLDTLHIIIVQSLDADAKYSPRDENATLFTQKE